MPLLVPDTKASSFFLQTVKVPKCFVDSIVVALYVIDEVCVCVMNMVGKSDLLDKT